MQDLGIHRPGGVLADPSGAMGFLWSRRGLAFWYEVTTDRGRTPNPHPNPHPHPHPHPRPHPHPHSNPNPNPNPNPNSNSNPNPNPGSDAIGWNLKVCQ